MPYEESDCPQISTLTHSYVPINFVSGTIPVIKADPDPDVEVKKPKKVRTEILYQKLNAYQNTKDQILEWDRFFTKFEFENTTTSLAHRTLQCNSALAPVSDTWSSLGDYKLEPGIPLQLTGNSKVPKYLLEVVNWIPPYWIKSKWCLLLMQSGLCWSTTILL